MSKDAHDYYAYLSEQEEKESYTNRIKSIFNILTWIKDYNLKAFKGDAVAGFITALIVTPQCIAFTAIAGIPATYGFYTAIVIPLISVFFASSRHMVNGPTIAISMLLYSIVSHMYTPNTSEYIHVVLSLTLLAGIFQLILYLLRFDFILRFVSNSVLKSFTAGAAILIIIHQIKPALGIHLPEKNLGVWMEMFYMAKHINTYINPLALGITLFTILVILLFSLKISNGLANLVAIVLSSLIAFGVSHAFSIDLDLAPSVSHITPQFMIPAVNMFDLENLYQNAFALAIIALIASISISSALGEISKQKIDTRQEVLNQSLSNIMGSFFGTMLSAGSFSRSGLNMESGATTPISGIITSLTVTIVLLFGGEILHYIPLSAIAGVIILIAIRLIKLKELITVIKRSRSERYIIAVTFFSAIIFGLQISIYWGVLASLFVFIFKSAQPRIFILEYLKEAERFVITNKHTKGESCPQIILIRIQGPVYYGSVTFVEKAITKIQQQYNGKSLMIIGGEGITSLDWDGANLLATKIKKANDRLCIAGLSPNILSTFKRYEIFDKDLFFESKGSALKFLIHKVNTEKCRTCTKTLFHECEQLKTNK